MITVNVQYYALLREQAGTSRESISTSANTATELYEVLRQKHPFTLARSQLRVAINGDFADWNATLENGAEVVFIPPVAGG